jgi:hypothetical protein
MVKEKAMSVTVHVSAVINRPVADVFRIHAREHVRNHPRWDPFMQVEQLTEDPFGVGTIMKRINSRSGAPVEGTMEVVEYEPDRAFGMIIQDGPLKMVSRAVYKAIGNDRTQVTYHLEIPDMDESMTETFASLMEMAIQTHKQFIESEVQE